MNKAKKIVILGAGGTGKDVLDTINQINAKNSSPVYKVAGFLDDNPELKGQEINGAKVLGPINSAGDYADCCFVDTLGSPNNFLNRENVIAELKIQPDRFETIIHPTASVSPLAQLGQGVIILQNVSVTSNVQIGHHVIVLANAVINHDDVLEDFVILATSVCLSGKVKVGRRSYIGANSSVKEGLMIGQNALVGMGSVVLENVPDENVYAGNPAKFLKKSQ